ncbi:family 20 glycosylhydrolase [Paenibacillus typhae]|uniref:beta-N-acetylhexosaminidase n=1 Tax=Paenibacillus typhae TaxID=1174501 RepID=A0A1G9A565_9BACL|nr:family 20 glycosylhydrolase [Paenibacillus typhae]SDK22453.1 Glycosyl hydrolase family 20, domain 2 [Paenibacillus typhae]
MPEICNLQLLPGPQTLTMSEGLFRIPLKSSIILPATQNRDILPAARRLQEAIGRILQLSLSLSVGIRSSVRPAASFCCNPLLPAQGYEITIAADGITITYSTPEGAYYAVATLQQILEQCGREVPCLFIRDQPDFAARGLMLDISRNKIPKLETLYKLIDLMSDLKFNQLQLYIEGSPFAYESFPQAWELETPVTGDEILLLDAYCRERYIELVPNQNSFGHMEHWLTRPEFNHLAEIPEGFMLPDHMYDHDLYPDGLFMQPGTFHTGNPEVLELLETMYDDLLPYFTSAQFNVGCDETYELGLGKSKALADSAGKGRLYLSFLLEIHKLVTARGKKMQFWGDIIIQHPELIPLLPKDIIAMEWGYSAEHPFEADTLKFREAQIPFYVCPGTSSWNSVTGRTDNMLANLRSAAVHGKENGAIGYLITDWGDFGHWQHLPVSYAGYVYGAALAWNVRNNLEADVAGYLNRSVFRDRSDKTGQLLLDLGNYYKMESGALRPNDSELSMLLRSRLDNMGIAQKLSPDQLDQLETYILGIENRLEELSPGCSDAGLVLQELANGIHFLKHAVQLARIKLQLAGEPDALNPAVIRRMIKDLDLLIHEYRGLWTRRNRPGGLEQSVSRLLRLRGEYEALLHSLPERPAAPSE